MRILMLAAVLLALAMVPAQAQMGGGRHRPSDDGAKAEKKGSKIDEKAYNEALKRIPEPKEKYDPWSGARPPVDQKPK